jgi:alkylmercury lyase
MSHHDPDPDDRDVAEDDQDHNDDQDRHDTRDRTRDRPSDPACSCCASSDDASSPSTGDGSVDDWRPADGMLDTELPASLQAALEAFVADGEIATLGDWTTVVRERTGGGPIAVEDLCATDEPTPHWGVVDGDRQHYACFYDAVVLAALTDSHVEIRTESPDGTVIEAEATPDGAITVTPSTTVVSFGIDPAAAESVDERDPTHADAYAAICPYVRAFPTRDAYADWAGTVHAPTIALPLADATALAHALAD